jgi:hypothetical protein
MKLAILAVFALLMGTGGSTCIESAPFKTAGPCPSWNCAVPEPAPFQTAGPCRNPQLRPAGA